MSEGGRMKHGTLTLSRRINAGRRLVYEAWTALEHRRHWFAGPAWTEIRRSVDLRIGGGEVAHGRFENGVETINTSHFHLIEPDTRLVYSFDMHAGGRHFSVSLAGVEFHDEAGATILSYTEQGFFLVGDYDETSRLEGTEILLDQFTAYLSRTDASSRSSATHH